MFFLKELCAMLCLVAQSYPTLCNPTDCSLRLLCPRGFSKQEYWSGWPCPSPEDLPKPGIKPRSPVLQAYSVQSEPPGKPRAIAYILNRRVKINMSQVQNGEEGKELRNIFSQH